MLETIWFILWVLLWAIYLALDGFDLGIGALAPFVCRNESERNSAYHSVGPFWDGNEVWLVAAAGITFAAFPAAYAAAFSALYVPVTLLVFSLIVRGAAIGLRGEAESGGAKAACDAAFSAGSLLAAVLLGVIFANLIIGVPIDRAGVNRGGAMSFLGLKGLLGGALTGIFCLSHGCLWLTLKSGGDLRLRTARLAGKLLTALALVSALVLATAAFSAIGAGYMRRPAIFAFPLLAVAGLAGTAWFAGARKWGAAWSACGIFALGGVASGWAGIYPILVNSSLDPAFSISAASAASSPLTLKIMLGVVVFFLPLIIAYQAFAYRVFRGPSDSGPYGH